MRALKPGGVLSVTLWNKEEPPKSVLKLYATMAEAAPRARSRRGLAQVVLRRLELSLDRDRALQARRLHADEIAKLRDAHARDVVRRDLLSGLRLRHRQDRRRSLEGYQRPRSSRRRPQRRPAYRPPSLRPPRRRSLPPMRRSRPAARPAPSRRSRRGPGGRCGRRRTPALPPRRCRRPRWASSPGTTLRARRLAPTSPTATSSTRAR